MVHVFKGVLVIALTAAAVGCGQRAAGPVAPSSVTAALENPAGGAQVVATAEQPPFNLEAILRGDGFGLVTFRQDRNPAQNIVTLDTFIRDVRPNTSYNLQRAVDTVLDGVCANTSGWLTLGQGPTPFPIVTDDTGTGRASLFRDLSAFAPGATFDIDFRIIEHDTGTVVLQSECYRFVVRN